MIRHASGTAVLLIFVACCGLAVLPLPTAAQEIYGRTKPVAGAAGPRTR